MQQADGRTARRYLCMRSVYTFGSLICYADWLPICGFITCPLHDPYMQLHLRLLDPEEASLKRHELFSGRGSVTFQKTWIVINTTVITSDLGKEKYSLRGVSWCVLFALYKPINSRGLKWVECVVMHKETRGVFSTLVGYPSNKIILSRREAFGGSTERRFIHSVFCLTTGPKPPPKRFLHIVRSRASSFKWEYPLLSLRSSSNFLRLLPRLLVTSISPFIFPSITFFRRQFLRKMWQGA